MTVEEFDTQFDIFYNNIASNAAPSVDTYEKSVFLTQAQRDIVVELYSGRAISGVSFESTEEARSYLRELITTEKLDNTNKTNKNFSLPSDLMFILTEEVKYKSDNECISNFTPMVIPKRLDYIQRDLKNPFRGPSKEIVLRTDGEGNVTLYSIYDIDTYTITYLRRPKPIIIPSEDSDLKIEESSADIASECELNPILHKAILDRAVALAKTAYIGK